MLKSFYTIAIRNLKRQFSYSLINILGLAVGMACSLVIFLYVYGEYSYDRHYDNGDRIYRIGVSFFNIGQFANGPEKLKEKLVSDFEGVEAMTRFQKNSQELVSVGGQTFKELVYNIDREFFRVFSRRFANGDPNNPFPNEKGVVLTKSAARKFFGDKNPVGEVLEIGKEKVPYPVTGVVEDDAHNSHLNASIWISLDERAMTNQYWTSAAVYNYVLLRENVSVSDLRTALDRVIEKYVYPDSGAPKAKISLSQYVSDENSVKFFIHPLKDIYLKSKVSLELSPGGNETNMIIFAIVGIFILSLAGINFINLATARATRRAKEVGVRKSLGTTKGKLVYQFLLESVLTSLLALVVALCLAELFAFIFFWVTGQQLTVRLWTQPIALLVVVGFSIVVGILSGVYPAFYLTRFDPVKVLKGTLHEGKAPVFRNVLVVFQFSVSVTLMVCCAVIISQLSYMSSKDLGFTQENILTIDNISMLGNRAVTWRDHLLQQPGVVNASLHGGEPGNKSIMSFYTYKTDEMQNELTINTYLADANYLDVMGMKLVKGRNFNPALASDSSGIILNEEAVRALNLQGDPIGAIINKNQTVIGIVANFHWESLRNAIAPVAIVMPDEKKSTFTTYQLALKIKPESISSVLRMVADEWKQYVPDEALSTHFVDDNFGAIVKKEQVLAKAIGFFTLLAVIISCLGLFGLSAYITDQRTKEIGIRKVLGATIARIIVMLNTQFTILVLVSLAIAIPASYYIADWWLSGFAYRTAIGISPFLLSALAALVITYLTVAFHSLKAARINPARTLKAE